MGLDELLSCRCLVSMCAWAVRATYHVHGVLVVAAVVQQFVIFDVKLFKVVRILCDSSSVLLLFPGQLTATSSLLFFDPSVFLYLGEDLVLVREQVGNARILLDLGSPFWVLQYGELAQDASAQAVYLLG
jgi:hypothetical protein